MSRIDNEATLPQPTAAGRSCPLHYRYRPADMAVDATLETGTLYVVGGLYGNGPALDEVLRLFEAEPCVDKRLVFNGDFHWFDIDPVVFERVTSTVLSFDAIRGNVETELADPDADEAAGCGCAYPEWVGDGVVERSNRILARLRQTARQFPALCSRMAALPMWLRADVGGHRIAIVHGDAQSLAGWGFAQEHLRDAGHLRNVARWFDEAQVEIFASSHTCLPVLQRWPDAGERPRIVVNNGAAGMPNLAGASEGLLTRISTRRFDGPQQRFGCETGGLFIDGIGIGYDNRRWQHRFCTDWPPGSDACESYWARISSGSEHPVADVVRGAAAQAD